MARTAVNAVRKGTYVAKEINTADMPVEQKATISDDPSAYDGDIVLVDKPLNKEWAEAMEFNEEPVTIRLEPSTDKFASNVFEVRVNGKGAEVFQNGKWMEITYLPVGVELITKRKYVEVIIRAKIDTITTDHGNANEENPRNLVKRATTPIHSMSIIRDDNPKSAAWAQELRRRNF